MRLCVFGPDVDILARGDWTARLTASVGTGHDITLLTNSWAESPAEPYVHYTGSARHPLMRLSRKLLQRRHASPTWRHHLVRAFITRLEDSLVEGLRAADPDLVVSLHPEWTAHIQRTVRRHELPWPCITIGDAPPPIEQSWRRYDPGVKVSIVLPTYNGVRYLAQAIAGCLSQTHANIELVVVDDGSGPAVDALIRAHDDPRIVRLRHAVNRGLPAALNTGFAAATGTLLTWTSDDNRYALDAIERMVRFVQTYPDTAFVYAESYRLDEQEVESGTRRNILRTRPPESLVEDNFIGACFLYTREVYEGIGDYSPKALLAEDYDYWVRVHQRFAMQRLFVPLYMYRFHSESLTARHTREEILTKVRWVKQARRVG